MERSDKSTSGLRRSSGFDGSEEFSEYFILGFIKSCLALLDLMLHAERIIDDYNGTSAGKRFRHDKRCHQRKYEQKHYHHLQIHEQLMDECEKQLGGWTKTQEMLSTESYFPSVPAPKSPVSEHIEIPEKSETSLIMGTMGPGRSDPDYLNAVLGNSILGEFGMMGRIGRTVREENGLAYYAGSSLTALTYGGCWTVEAGVNPANVENAADLIMSELKRFTSEKVSSDELDDVKSFYLGSLPLSLESNSGTAALLMNIETHHLGLDYLQHMPERVTAVTADSILAAARKWLDPEKMVRVTAGTTKQ